MVNEASGSAAERRQRPRGDAAHAAALGVANLNPFGDLHTLQHLSARFARGLRHVFEPILRRATRSWAEPLSVMRFADYVAERPKALTAWLPMAIRPAGGAVTGHALLVLDGRFTLELLDLYFGGLGEAPAPLPSEFSPAAEALVERLGRTIAEPLAAAWEPVARLELTAGRTEINAAMLHDFDGEDAVIVTRFGIAAASDKPVFVDLVYPVAALKPIGPSLNTRVIGRTADPEPKWRNGLTRAAMGVRFPVRSVLAEPTMSLGALMELKEGDVIPVSFGQFVPIMVGTHRLGTGVVGTQNGRAAICIHHLEQLDLEDEQP
ncbi:flagellar motor switch protein FliM [Sphingomonas spermidinifaciens]|uniref:Flagellar motor switch protein FliM n=1 Tax=Sphingomonas spermidinifaciens TaxID=1141889 RepID=A0A2A4B8R8_9SPHN|nr:flagellar motor switch protein FliM [Sphingomonas spermidinifaciens]PCD04054.1 flagellar motor switch protein FliM [Sphingomonas spermidinifaciens]